LFLFLDIFACFYCFKVVLSKEIRKMAKTVIKQNSALEVNVEEKYIVYNSLGLMKSKFKNYTLKFVLAPICETIHN